MHWTPCGSNLGAAMSEAAQAKRRRLDPNQTGVRYKVQNVSFKPNGDLWPSHEILLLADDGVVVDGKGPHGWWNNINTCFNSFLYINWHWNAEESKAKTCTYVHIPETQCWVQTGCDPAWKCVLAPVSIPGSTMVVPGFDV